MRDNKMYTMQGFTLVELLTVMVLLMTIGLLIGAILFASLRGTTKTTVVANVRENGNYAITIMAKKLRYAQNFMGISSTGASDSYVTDCSTLNPNSSNNSIQFQTFTEGKVTYSCQDTNGDGNDDALIAETVVNGITRRENLLELNTVSLVSCSFSCKQNSVTTAYTIGIDFSLRQKNESASSENSTVIPFHTSVTLRNN